MKTTFLSRITLAGLLLSAAASGTALAQAPERVQAAPAAHHVAHRHGHAHHLKHHHKTAQHKGHRRHKHRHHAK